MKKIIEKIKDKGEEHTKKMVTVFAAISTLIIVIAWLLLLSFTKPNESVVAEPDPNAPDIGAFLEEAGSQLGEIVDSVKETSSDLQEAIETAQQAELERVSEETTSPEPTQEN